MKHKLNIQVLISFVFMCHSSYAYEYKQTYEIQLIGGTFFGPGAMVDSPMPKGRISNIEFTDFLNGKTPFFNNGSDLPNIVIDERFSSMKNALLSNGEKYNEHMNGGIVDIGLGAMNLVNLVAANGPNKGIQFYNFDDKLNWNITTDLALDPGYEHGLLTISNLLITTGVVWIPISKQTQTNIPGGTDAAGSLLSGTAMIGKLGDQDNDGFLDGTLVGQSVIPIDHLFSPGAPAAQLRTFSSNIPVNSHDAMLLYLTGIQNFNEVWSAIKKESKDNNYLNNWDDYFSQIEERVVSINNMTKINQSTSEKDLTPINENIGLIRTMLTENNSTDKSIDKFKRLNDELFVHIKTLVKKMLVASTELSANQS